ncbi:endonuclease/exonuclease/phosphatase family protein [Micromonospora chersina]|uniref:endonuclease/exonuclease/phosphatase family protein n=1 Tax=Micromonospora chersina TaxID=47854 RepID=UPI00370F8C73
MAQVDTAESGQGGAGTWRARIGPAIRAASRPGPWKRGRVLAALALLLGLLMLLHAKIPNRIGNLGSLVETFLPWFGLFIPVLLIAALWRRSASGADVLALVELTEEARGTYETELAKAYPYHTVQGTVGLWSKLPLSDTQPVDTKMDAGPLADTKPLDIKMAYNRALRTTVATNQGPLAVYVAHLGSARVNPRAGFWTAHRDRNAQALGEAIAAEQNERVVLLGDLNGTMDDRAFASITSRLRSAQDAAGNGFGFTWPAKFPVVRIDQILVRGVKAGSSWVLPATGSDHLPVAARITP